MYVVAFKLNRLRLFRNISGFTRKLKVKVIPLEPPERHQAHAIASFSEARIRDLRGLSCARPNRFLPRPIMPVEAAPVPNVSPPVPSDASASILERLSNWASKNKAVVYTVGAVAVVVTGAGIFYFSTSNDSRGRKEGGSADKRRSKKERREAKRSAEEAKKKGQRTPAWYAYVLLAYLCFRIKCESSNGRSRGVITGSGRVDR